MFVIMEKLFIKISNYFEYHFGWFFVNGKKYEKWEEKMRKKYGK